MTDLDSSDLFLDYCHGPDKIQEVTQSVKLLFNSDFGNLELISESIGRELSSTSFILIFLVFLDM